MLATSNLIGALTAVTFYLSSILVFVFRLLGRPDTGRHIGYFQFLLAAPLVYLLWTASRLGRPALYYLQVSLMLLFLLVELLLDTLLKLEFRQVRGMVIAYVVLFFAGAGGMLGIAANAGPFWTALAAFFFLAMAILTFVQRRLTGM